VRETRAFGGGTLDRCLARGEETPQDRIDERDRPGFLQAPTGLGGGRHGGVRGHAQATGLIQPSEQEGHDDRVLPLHRVREEPAEPEIEAGQPAQDAVADLLRQGPVLGIGQGREVPRQGRGQGPPVRHHGRQDARGRGAWLRAIPRPHILPTAVARAPRHRTERIGGPS